MLDISGPQIDTLISDEVIALVQGVPYALIAPAGAVAATVHARPVSAVGTSIIWIRQGAAPVPAAGLGVVAQPTRFEALVLNMDELLQQQSQTSYWLSVADDSELYVTWWK